MSATSKNTDTISDDIDLLLLIERFLFFFRKYRWVFVIAVVLGIGAGIFMYRSLPHIYRSRLVLHSYILTNPEQIQLVANWNELLQKKEYPALAAALNCPENILRNVKRLKAEEIQKTSAANNPSGFIVDVNITSNAVLEELQKGLVYGFENCEYIRERLTVRRAALEELIAKTTTEILKLDSTKKVVENIIAGKGTSSSSLIVDGSSINRQLIEMNEKLLGYKGELKFTNAVQVLQSFNKYQKPIGPKLLPWLVIGLLVFLSIAFLFSIFNSINTKLKKRTRLSAA
jgi:uncharacterized protein involved in exopolysaccharide biosynthesis